MRFCLRIDMTHQSVRCSPGDEPVGRNEEVKNIWAPVAHKEESRRLAVSGQCIKISINHYDTVEPRNWASRVCVSDVMLMSVVKNDGGKGNGSSLSRAAKKNHKTSSDEETLSASM